eukprot:TRINITY_DN12371_c0_g1_i1.p1 TRINITY_DN12371_c0_g1~~TRINITY_DN12371_c0_g1_i1.p1  ORF type:complete len:572 (+),score=162.30 TRINITY_DN12371_c0_g1_i1:115-1830(+)
MAAAAGDARAAYDADSDPSDTVPIMRVNSVATTSSSSSSRTSYGLKQGPEIAPVIEALPPLRSWEGFVICLEVLLGVITCLGVGLVYTEDYNFNAQMRDTISGVFVSMDGWTSANERGLFGVEQTKSSIVGVVQNHAALNTSLPAAIALDPYVSMELRTVNESYRELLRQVISGQGAFDRQETVSYHELTMDDPLGPLADNELWWHVNSVHLSLRLELLHLRTWVVADEPSSLEWDLNLRYDLTERDSYVRLSWDLDVTQKASPTPPYSLKALLMELHFLVSVLLLWEALRVWTVRAERWPLQHDVVSPYRWRWIRLSSAGANLAHAALKIYTNIIIASAPASYEHPGKLVHAVAGFLCFLCLCRPLAQIESLNVFILSAHSGFPQAMKLFVPVIIIFLAFATCGMYWFGGLVYHFNTLDLSIELLYSQMVGDALYITFHQINDAVSATYGTWGIILGRVFCYVAIIISYIVVLNQFFAVMEDAYVRAKKHKKAIARARMAEEAGQDEGTIFSQVPPATVAEVRAPGGQDFWRQYRKRDEREERTSRPCSPTDSQPARKRSFASSTQSRTR